MNVCIVPGIFTLPMKKEIFLRNLGARIRLIRIEKGLTQAQLAAKIGKTQQSIQKLESGKFNPSIKYLLDLADGLEINMKKLLETL